MRGLRGLVVDLFMFAVLAAALLAGWSLLASARGASPPVPDDDGMVEPPPGVYPGQYELRWGGTLYHMTLTSGGKYYAASGSEGWEGTYCWDAGARTFTVDERPHGSRGGYVTFSSRLCPRMEGAAAGAYAGTRFAVIRKKGE